ncbi:MAG: phage major capsid protein [Niameybacter sp.]
MKLTAEQQAKYDAMLGEAQELLNKGDVEAFDAKIKEADEYVAQCEKINQKQAELNALSKGTQVVNIASKGNGPVVGHVIDTIDNTVSDDIYNSKEYRKAFMNYAIKGEAIPGQFTNADAITKTSDVGVVIPTTVLEKIIEKLEATGMILPLVTRTSIKGGITVPTSAVKPVATWVAEGAGSDKQKKTTGTITFAYHKLRCAVAVSFEVDLMAMSVFETALINNVVEAMTKALEQAIISGTGVGQPKGILTETPVTGQALQASALSYDLLIEAEAALPLEYEAGAVYCMTKKTFMAYQGIKDSAGQPIARVTYGIGGKPERTLLGRPVVLCNYLESFATGLTAGKVFAFLFNFKDYVLNTNYNMGIKKYEDNETDDQVTKAIMVADGKVLVKESLVTIAKKA